MAIRNNTATSIQSFTFYYEPTKHESSDRQRPESLSQKRQNEVRLGRLGRNEYMATGRSGYVDTAVL